uniref:Adenosine deaminase-like protein n=1 Tax=Caligus rogercresseyi TaxID=217165 RepID=C1BRD4_CALRO|nr:Adenosine deaminase-like protein [Caligus rogercresseyi]
MDFLQSLPKIELHAHLSGSVAISFLVELQDTSLSRKDFDDLYDYFPEVQSLLSSKKRLAEALRIVLEDFRQDGVVYLELRSSPRVGKDYSKEEYIRIIAQILQDEARDLPLIAKLLISIDRSKSIQDAKENLDLFIRLSEEFPDTIVGLEVSGNPKKGDMKGILALIEEHRRVKHFRVSIHCGEEPHLSEIKDILAFKPDRIGHGVHVNPSDAPHIPWEVCLTSNIMSGSVPSYEEHVLKSLIQMGIPFSLCTDDSGLFRTNLSQEYEHMRTKVMPSASNAEIFKMSMRPIDFTFCDEALRGKLKDFFKGWEIDNGDKYKLIG